MAAIPEDFHDLFEKRTFAHVATMLPDGYPHVTPVWIDYDPDAERLLFNTATGRQKEQNLERNPKVGVSMCDPEDPYRYCAVWGEVAEVTTDGAVDHIDELARRYMDVEEYPYHGDDEGERVIVQVAPESVLTSESG